MFNSWNKLDKESTDHLILNVTASPDGYMKAGLVTVGNVPGIGFHNPGIEGAALCLHNGKLVLIFNNSDVYIMNMAYYTHTDIIINNMRHAHNMGDPVPLLHELWQWCYCLQ